MYLAWMTDVFITVALGCDPYSGPAGFTQCFLGYPDYSKYQCGTCLTDAYIRQRSRGEHVCEDSSARYCYYQCMIEKHNLFDEEFGHIPFSTDLVAYWRLW